jgi:hypothetical protein
MEEDNIERAEEVLNRISQSCPIDDAKNIAIHTDEEGKQMLVSIPENERKEES